MPVSDAALCEALSMSLGRSVERVERAPWVYASSVPMEELRVEGAAPMLLKDLGVRERPSRPAFLVEPLREVEAYRSLLDGLDAPRLIAASDAPDAPWIVVERVDGRPLWQADGLAAWEAAARWLARLHQRPVPRARHLLRYDAAHFHRWLERAQTLTPPGALDEVAPAAERAIALLGAWPRALLHGEPYPSNVLVEDEPSTCAAGPRIRPVDWETAGVGPGVLDLAALTSGAWPEAERARVVAAYREASGLGAKALDAALDAARLVVALQWLGWSATWTAPPEHAHDWLAEARVLARRTAS